MSVLIKMTRSAIMVMLNTKGRQLPPEFTLAQAFAAITDDLIAPTMSDMRVLGSTLTRMGFGKYRTMEHGERKTLWFKGGPNVSYKKKEVAAEEPWVGELLTWADEQRDPFRLEDALIEGTRLGNNSRLTMGDLQHAGAALRDAGYAKDRQMIGGVQAIRWGRA